MVREDLSRCLAVCHVSVFQPDASRLASADPTAALKGVTVQRLWDGGGAIAPLCCFVVVSFFFSEAWGGKVSGLARD